MSSTAIATVTKMLETLPEAEQERAVEHLRDYVEELQAERQWEASFDKARPRLVAAARRVRREIAAGLAQPMDYEKL